MDKFINFYQHLPQKIDPVAISFGIFSINWYSLMYLVAFSIVYFLLKYRIKKGEIKANGDWLWDFIIYSALGVVIGGRLGFVFFYDFQYFFKNPLEIISPFSNGEYVGIYGMSYHGGLIGVLIAIYFFLKKYNFLNFWQLADFVLPAIPAGYFFGRLGNFFNGEIYGITTSRSWGMYFYDGIVWQLRHPVQLYEAFFEGLAIFAILWILRNKKYLQGCFLSLYLFGYGLFRFFLEFLREPDRGADFIGNISLGQIFCLIMMVSALYLYFLQKNKKVV